MPAEKSHPGSGSGNKGRLAIADLWRTSKIPTSINHIEVAGGAVDRPDLLFMRGSSETICRIVCVWCSSLSLPETLSLVRAAIWAGTGWNCMVKSIVMCFRSTGFSL